MFVCLSELNLALRLKVRDFFLGTDKNAAHLFGTPEYWPKLDQHWAKIGPKLGQNGQNHISWNRKQNDTNFPHNLIP